MNLITSYYNQMKRFIATATSRLAFSYLVIIMLMSVGFSIVFYNTSEHELRRQGPPTDSQQQVDDNPTRGFGPGADPVVRAYLEDRAAEARHALKQRLIMLNIGTLVVGAALSYYLARRTLEPIEANMEAQAQFVSDASHELRTPLTAMQTSNEVALRRPKLSSAEAKKILAENVADVVRLRALTDGLLRLARQDANDIVLSSVSLPDVATEAINCVIPVASAKRIQVEDKVANIAVLADKQLLVQVLVILLDNAVKYSPEKSTIFVTAEIKGKQAVISVRDEGIGISAEDLPRIFDRFFRADSARATRDGDGYGIGLSIAQKLVGQLGGQISAKSEVGKGSSFSLRLVLS